jgi:hypothetical protein
MPPGPSESSQAVARPPSNNNDAPPASRSALTESDSAANLLNLPAAPKHVRRDSAGSDGSVGSTWSASACPTTPASDVHEPDIDTRKLLDIDPSVASKDGVFAFTVKQLIALHETRDPGLLKAMGGIEGLCLGLRTDLETGLSPEEDHFAVPVTLNTVVQQLQATHGIDQDDSANLVDLEAGVNRTDTQRLSLSRRFSMLTLASSAPKGFSDRKSAFGENELPKRAQKSLFSLMWHVLQDKVLVSPPCPVKFDL